MVASTQTHKVKHMSNNATAVVSATNAALTQSIALVTNTGMAPLELPNSVSISVSAAAPVPANDTKNDKLAPVLAMKELEQLIADRENWQQTAFKTSNDMLYRLLERCYEYYQRLCADNAAGKHARDGLELYIQSRGLTFKKSTHTIAKILACVFGTDRRRISAYSIALRAALQNKVPVAELVHYISQAGGVEELRLAKNPNAMTTKSKAETAAHWMAEYKLASVKADELTAELDAANVGSRHVLLVTQCADGSVTVHGIVSNQGVVDAALAAFYSKHNKSRSNATAEAEVAKGAEDMNDLIAQAAAQTHR